MTKNRGILVALAVLVAAGLLMFFVVLPALRDGKVPADLAGKVEDAAKQATDAAKQATDAAKEAADKAADAAKDAAAKATDAAKQATDEAAKVATDVAGDLKSVVGEKMGRLKADTLGAADELKTLLSAQPADAAAIAAGKAKLEASLKAVAAFKAPEGLDATLGGLTQKTSEAATAALDGLAKLPADQAQAGQALDSLKAGLASAFEAVEKAISGTAATDDKAAATTEEAQPAAALALPAFDVLRVEKDGSTVIAGRASPEAKVEIMDGDKAIAATTATESGDFVAVLDNPLSAGDHTIVLKVTGKDGKELVSEEVATVSVPKDATGELLAMVTKPGEASRIITAPAANGDAAATTDVAAADPAKAVTNEAAKATEAETQAAADAAKATTDQAQTDQAQTDQAQTDQAATDQAAGKPADVAIATPDLPAASSVLAGSAPVVGTENQAAEPAADAKPADQAQPEVQVSAVEIEGDHLFVAGATRPGALVRIYADDKLVGEGKANEAGRFVVDNVMPLSVGSHTIRADVLSADGSKVEFRASVPFDRPEGEQLAVVADQNAAPGTNADLVPLDAAKLDKARGDAAKALALLNGLFAGGKTPTAEELAAARSASEIALKALADLAATGDDAAKATAEAAAKALDALKALPADAAGVSAGLAGINSGLAAILPAEVAMAESATKSATTETADEPAGTSGDQAQATDKAATDTQASDQTATETGTQAADQSANQSANQSSGTDQSKAAEDAAASQPADQGQDAAQATTGEQSGEQAGDQPKVIEQAPLKESKTTVIIRKGDTLWQISRRIYGRGVRYTTIYVANKDQIADPDAIMPGQVFGLPDTWLPNSEELHRDLLEKHLQLHKRRK